MKWGSSKSLYNPMEMYMYSTESSPGNGWCQVHNDIKSLVSGQIVTRVTGFSKNGLTAELTLFCYVVAWWKVSLNPLKCFHQIVTSSKRRSCCTDAPSKLHWTCSSEVFQFVMLYIDRLKKNGLTVWPRQQVLRQYCGERLRLSTR